MDASITKVLQAVQEEFPPSRTHPRRKSSSAHSNASPSPSMSSSFIGSIPIADDNSLPTSSELYSYTGQSPDPNTHSSSFALSTSPSEVDEQGLPHLHTSGTSAYPSASFSVTGSGSGSGSTDGQETPRAERTAPLSAEAVTNNTYLHTSLDDDSRAIPERQEISSSSAMPTNPTSGNNSSRTTFPANTPSTSSFNSTSITNTSKQRSPRMNSAPTFISLPPLSSNSREGSSAAAGFKLSSVPKGTTDGLMLTPGGDDIPFQFKKRPDMQERRPSREIFA